MAIIRYTKEASTKYAYLNLFPDQFKTDKEKEDEGWIKNNLDYFANKAYAEYKNNKDTFVKNYDLMKGILRMEDFYQETDVKSFTDILEADLKLPAYVKHYSIITTPINELVGEITKRPDTYRVKAFDDDSKAEELQYKTEILQAYVISAAKEKILMKQAQAGGEEMSEEDLNTMTMESVKEEIDSYTSVAEKWANKVLTCHKADFNLKEKSEEAFRDLCISAREYYHVYEDNSKTGFNVKVLNPKNVWSLTSDDKKYISDPSGRAQGAYAVGTVEVMEFSEIIESNPDITKEEIDHLRSLIHDNNSLIDVRESNIGKMGNTGINSIVYDTYDPLVIQDRMMLEGEISANQDGDLESFLGIRNDAANFGTKFVVTTSYWISKKKIGKLVYIDEVDNEQTLLVDESYKSGDMPTEISLKWGWINQWFQGRKTGQDIYHVKPFRLLDYSPIIGTIFENKNTTARSVVDLMKPFQVLYNVALNQLFELLKKEIGKVQLMSLRHVPIPKDGDAQDALDIWEMEARERGVIFIDDSPENLKSPSGFNQFRDIDLTRTQEIQSRYNLAVQMKNECWELIGMSKQRMGSVSAGETATATNVAVQQSYTQTEPLFVAHEYVMGQLYQAIVDASQYIEGAKEESTLSYITSEGESAFIKVNGSDIKLRDLKVFLTNRPEDTQMFNELRGLAQAVIQNGGSLYDIIELYSTKSMREMKKTFKNMKERIEALQNQQAEEQKAQREQQAQIAQAQMEEARMALDEKYAFEEYQNELDRISEKEIAIIKATGFGQVESEDVNNNNVPDVLEVSKLDHELSKATKDYQFRMSELQSKHALDSQKLALEKEKLQVARENQKNDLQIARENVKGRNNKKK